MIKPYYDEDGITIYNCDCREVLGQLEPVDLVLTDPPYGIQLSGKRPAKMQKHQGSSYTFGEDSPEYVDSLVVPVVASLIKSARRVVLTPGIRCLFKYPEPTTVWALHWPNGAGVGRWSVFTCWQPVLCYGESPKRKGSIPDTFTTTEQAQANGHPCPKPIALWKRLLAAASNTGDVVLDPFMGSGTTLRAAKDLGLRAIGIEIEEKYCAIAVERLRQQVLFTTEAA